MDSRIEESRKATDLGSRSPAGSIWFQGDWSDPWLEGIAGALPRDCEIHRLDPLRGWPGTQSSPDLLIVQRARLTLSDADQFAAWKTASAWPRFPATILCHGAYARYAELERWLGLVEDAIPEATAADTLPRRVERCLKIDRGGTETAAFRDKSARVVLVSTNPDLRRTIADLCAEWVSRIVPLIDLRTAPGIPTESDSNAAGARTVTIIDVSLLETAWQTEIERAAGWGPVIALFGFPDRAAVETARSLGAWACLELPFNQDDLGYALKRCLRRIPNGREAANVGFEPGHRLPRAPASFRVTNPQQPSNRDA